MRVRFRSRRSLLWMFCVEAGWVRIVVLNTRVPDSARTPFPRAALPDDQRSDADNALGLFLQKFTRRAGQIECSVGICRSGDQQRIVQYCLVWYLHILACAWGNSANGYDSEQHASPS